MRGHCNSWKCEECGRKKQFMVAKAIETEVKKWKRIRFWRFSLNHKVAEIKAHRKIMQKAWNLLCKEIRRSKLLGQAQRNFQFVRVWERCKDGYFHFHVLCDEYLHREFIYNVWISAIRHAAKLSGLDFSTYGDSALCGCWVDSQTHFTPSKAAGYITKYISKSFQDEAHEAGERKYSKSREIVFFRRKESNGKWYYVKMFDADFDCNGAIPLPAVAFLSDCTITHDKPPERPPKWSDLDDSMKVLTSNIQDDRDRAENRISLRLFDLPNSLKIGSNGIAD